MGVHPVHLASTADWRLQAVCSLIISLKKTLVFAQRDDCGLTHEQQLKVNHDEVSHYKAVSYTHLAEIFRRLHNSGEDTGVPFEVVDRAAGYERIIHENHVSMYPDYEETKAVVMAIKKEIDAGCGIHKVPCHNDPLCENWVVSDSDRMYLIDWEYAGMNDPLWDVADLSIEAGFDAESDAKFLCAYLERKAEPADYRHFMAETLYVAYLWTLWAKTRVPYDGQPMDCLLYTSRCV